MNFCRSYPILNKLRYMVYTGNIKTACVCSDNGKNKLIDFLKTKIEATGPISVAEYMKAALTFPFSGYYMSRDVFGVDGDFITSPEISQMFGELIGVWLYNEWSRVGRPRPLQLVEFGPGRGTLMDDVLRIFSKMMSPSVDVSIHLIEMSPHLCKVQMSKLCFSPEEGDLYDKTVATKYRFPLTWHRHLETVPENFSLFLAHEFFDAMPIMKFQKTNDGWREVLIDFKNEEFHFVISRNETPAVKLLVDKDEERGHLEISPESGVLLDTLLKRMKEDGGISLIVDYGHLGDKTDTFRGFKKHQLHDPLKNVGEADLTADVDFSYLCKRANNKGVAIGPVSQSDFLHSMGIKMRLEKLLQSSSEEAQKQLKSGYDMLTSPDQMGERFKFLALYPMVLKDFLCKYPPAGF